MFKHLQRDIPASIVVFFVALPLCLGIALASGAPLFSGLISGIVGGIVVGIISKSEVGISGPAAGLAVIVLSAISSLGKFEYFLTTVVLAGIFQIVLGLLKAGAISNFFPNSVIKGMLAGIGLIIIIKQIPVVFGINQDHDFLFFFKAGSEPVLNEYKQLLNDVSLGAVLISLFSLLIIIFWEQILEKKSKLFKIIPGSLVVVFLGILYKILVPETSVLSISNQNLVDVPVASNAKEFFSQFTFPDFSVLFTAEVWVVAFTIAIVASIETLLSVEATDKLDPEKRITPTNRELVAQGTGNIMAGLIGGLPITQVIVRSSANIQSNNKTKLSGIIHGFLLLISVISLPKVLNLIPLSVLAAILLIVGYKLAKPSAIKEIIRQGKYQYVPYFVTVFGIVALDLLKGIGMGLVVGLLFVLYKSYKNSYFLQVKESDDEKKSKRVVISLAEEVTFFNKAALLKELSNIKPGDTVEFHFENTVYLDMDIADMVTDFAASATEKDIDVEIYTQKDKKQDAGNLKKKLSHIIK